MEIVHQHEQEEIKRKVSIRHRRVRVSREYATAHDQQLVERRNATALEFVFLSSQEDQLAR